MSDQVQEQPKTISAVSLDALTNLNEDRWTEVIDGTLVEGQMSPSYMHTVIIRQLLRLIDPFVMKNELGEVFPDGLMYVLHIDEAGVRSARIPDFSFIRKSDMPDSFDMTRPFMGAPTLAVEVVSPGEGNEILLPKISDYLRFGTEQVWVAYPEPRKIAIYITDATQPAAVYDDTQTLPTESFFPGLTLSVSDIFATP